LAKVLDADLFSKYIKGHIPTIIECGGKVVMRSINNEIILGKEKYDVIAIQEWPSDESFLNWVNSKSYEPWSKIRDKSAEITPAR
jgi:uncharacterized protein (DUF1330 family)